MAIIPSLRTAMQRAAAADDNVVTLQTAPPSLDSLADQVDQLKAASVAAHDNAKQIDAQLHEARRRMLKGIAARDLGLDTLTPKEIDAIMGVE